MQMIDWRQYETVLLDIDDNCRVLDAALAFGIRGVIEVTCPDTRMAVKEPGTHRGVRRVASLI